MQTPSAHLLRTLVVAFATALCFGALLPSASVATPTSCAGQGVVCAGAASVDMTWHTGAGQGQYGSEGNGITSDKFDPFHHQTKMVPSDGMQSRMYTKAIVVKGGDGRKVAYVKTELYLQQDVLTRRVGELLAGDPIAPEYEVEGLDGTRVMLGGTHNHSAPYYASTAWGVWLFTDSIDFRMFEATARKIASAVKQADLALEPAKIGASVTKFRGVQRNILGPATADDGTPAGFPHDWFDDELTVVRFDAADASHPIAALVNLGMHPESLSTLDLMSADFVGQVERIAERGMGKLPGSTSGPVVAWSQGSVGDVEPDQSRASAPASGREYWHRNFAQMEEMSNSLGAAILDTWGDVASGSPGVASKFVPFTSDLAVDMVDYRFAGPVSHPLPTVSNCKTTHPALPVVGLPDCERLGNPPAQYGMTLGLLDSLGVPFPDNFGSTPSYEGAQESLMIHLQAIRLGEILIASCPCEPVSDMVINFKSRSDRATGNLYLGHEWPCEAGPPLRCNFKQAAWRADDWRNVDPIAHARMQAQIRNNAAGWEEELARLQGEAEPADPAQIKGNYTHSEIQNLSCAEDPCDGYTLPIMVGQANDYVGYIVTYREYMRGDHYRKALTAFGPHTSDYVNTRLVKMGAQLRGGGEVSGSQLDAPAAITDSLLQRAKVIGAGSAGGFGTSAYEQIIPDDGGDPGVVVDEPTSLDRFGAATFSWQGGSNWTDNPSVRVEQQQSDGIWKTFATQEGGEIVLTLAYDSYFSSAPLDWLSGGKSYVWTAAFEVFEATPPGSYRFRVEGHHRSERQAKPYAVTSNSFDVSVWPGINAHSLSYDPGSARAVFSVDGVELTIPVTNLETDDDALIGDDEVHYPDSYGSAQSYVRSDLTTIDRHRFCFRCTFRKWADTGRVTSAFLTIKRASGLVQSVPAERQSAQWVVANLDLEAGDAAFVDAGSVADEFGNTNGEPSNAVGSSGEPVVLASLVTSPATVDPVPEVRELALGASADTWRMVAGALSAALAAVVLIRRRTSKGEVR